MSVPGGGSSVICVMMLCWLCVAAASPAPQGRLVEASAEEQRSRELAGTYSAQTTR